MVALESGDEGGIRGAVGAPGHFWGLVDEGASEVGEDSGEGGHDFRDCLRSSIAVVAGCQSDGEVVNFDEDEEKFRTSSVGFRVFCFTVLESDCAVSGLWSSLKLHLQEVASGSGRSQLLLLDAVWGSNVTRTLASITSTLFLLPHVREHQQ